MRSSVGSPGTEKGTVETPADWRAWRRGAARSGEAPVTRRARRPMDAAAAGTCRRVPSPKRMRAAVANSKVGMGVSRGQTLPVGQTLPMGQTVPMGQTLGQTASFRQSAPETWCQSRVCWFVGDRSKWFALFGLDGKMGSFGKHVLKAGGAHRSPHLEDTTAGQGPRGERSEEHT